MMFFKKKDNTSIELLFEEQQKIRKEIKELKEEIEKIDIKAMEAQKSYRAKLKRLTGDDVETNKNSSVFLSPHGNPI